jgi:hypothetical protein
VENIQSRFGLGNCAQQAKQVEERKMQQDKREYDSDGDGVMVHNLLIVLAVIAAFVFAALFFLQI